MNVVILWHMHQPYYVNPLTKKAMMPWVRLHAVKGYLDMIDLVTAQPDVRVNFNFTPVLIRQIDELVSGEVEDTWETLSRKPAHELDNEDRRHLIENFFCTLKDFRAIATRYDKLANSFLSGVFLASTLIWLN